MKSFYWGLFYAILYLDQIYAEYPLFPDWKRPEKKNILAQKCALN
jgi:hypothetical protein